MKEDRFIMNLIICLVLFSCKRESTPGDIPEYQPGRLTEVSYETFDLGLTYHHYAYKKNEVADYYYFSASEVFITKYHFNNEKLEKVFYSLENTNEAFFIDSLVYYYSDSLILEVNHYSDHSCDTVFYYLENRKIVFSTNRPGALLTETRTDRFYRWSGSNLVQYIEHNWILDMCFEINFVFQYSTMENPFFYSNIPTLLNMFHPPQGGIYYELKDLVPNCSRFFPSKISLYYNYMPGIEDTYSLECKIFPNANKPYKVSVVHTQYFTDAYEYFLTYEEL